MCGVQRINYNLRSVIKHRLFYSIVQDLEIVISTVVEGMENKRILNFIILTSVAYNDVPDLYELRFTIFSIKLLNTTSIDFMIYLYAFECMGMLETIKLSH